MRVGLGVSERSKRFLRDETDAERDREFLFERFLAEWLRLRLPPRPLDDALSLLSSRSLSPLGFRALSRDFGRSLPSRSLDSPIGAFRAGLFEREARRLRRSPLLDDDDDELRLKKLLSRHLFMRVSKFTLMKKTSYHY